LDEAQLKPREVEKAILAKLARADEADQRAILGLLGECGSSRSALALLQLARGDALRAEALATLERVMGQGHLAPLVARSNDRRVRVAMIERLLTVDSAAALRDYLSLVTNPTTAAEALAAAEKCESFPIDELIALLDSNDQAERLSAATVLGHVNGPETTQLLIARVNERPGGSTEAWLALMHCRGQMADEFLGYAASRPELLGYYNNARVRWAQMTP
jgi:hypothetical protein